MLYGLNIHVNGDIHPFKICEEEIKDIIGDLIHYKESFHLINDGKKICIKQNNTETVYYKSKEEILREIDQRID